MKSETVKKILNMVQSNYQEIALEFDLTRKNLTWPFLHKYCLNISDSEHILDVACGNGRLCQELIGKNINYLGIDSSQALINLASKNFPDFNFIQANFLDDNFLGSYDKKDFLFDKIFFLAALQHVPSKKLRVQALKSIKQYLKPNGEIIMSNWNIWQSRHRNKVIKNIWFKIIGKNELDFGDIIFPWKGKEMISDRYYHAFTKRELISLAKQAGFNNIKFFKDKHNYWLILK